MKYSIVIPTMNNAKCLLPLLESIEKYEPEDCEVIFVVQPSTDATNSLLRGSSYAILEPGKNIGWCEAINLGFTNATGDYLIAMNDDVIITPRLFEKLSSAINRVPHAGISGPLCNYVMSLQSIPAGYDTRKKDIQEIATFADSVEKENGITTRTASVVSGVCMMVKRDCYEALMKQDGFFFDPRFFCGWDDNDVCLRARELGYKSVIAKGAYLHHDGSVTMPGEKSMEKQSIFIDKWAARRKKNPKLVAAIWTMPDEEYLSDALWATRGFADETVVLFDTRRSKSPMPECFTNRTDLFDAYEVIDPTTPFHERTHRQQLIKLALTRNPDWVCVIDGDEVWQVKREDIQRLMNNPNPEAKSYQYNYENIWMLPDWIRTDDCFGKQAGPRIFKVEPNLEELTGGTPHTGQHGSPIPPPTPESTFPSHISGLHYGYPDDITRQHKYEWYIKTDIDKDPVLINGRQGAMGTGDYSHIIANNISIRRWKGVQRLTLCVIAKNEGKKLDEFFRYIYPCVHEIIGVNNASTDDTRARLEVWCDRFVDSNADSYADLRNLAQHEATGDWILFLDVDEQIAAGSQWDEWNKIHRLIHDPDADAYRIGFANLHPDGKSYYQPPNIRLYRRTKGIWKRPVHEYVQMDIGTRVNTSDLMIKHTGYLKPKEAREAKFKHYRKLMGAYLHSNPLDPQMHYYYAVELLRTNEIGEAMKHLEIAAKNGYAPANKTIGNIIVNSGVAKWDKYLSELPDGPERDTMSSMLGQIVQTMGPILRGD